MSVQRETQKLDLVAISLSGLCVMHCLALPALLSFAPLLGTFTDDWVHQLLVLVAAPLSLFVLLRTRDRNDKAVMGILISLGLAMLGLGAFAEGLHAHETPLTIAGALALVGAHAFRLWQNRAQQFPAA